MPSKNDLDPQSKNQKEIDGLVNLVLHSLAGSADPVVELKINEFKKADPANETWFEQVTNLEFLRKEIKVYQKPDIKKGFDALWALIAKDDAQNQ